MSEMQQLSDRAEQLISSLTSAYLTAGEVAAERIELASKVAAIRQRMAAHTAVLEMIGAQKAEIEAKLSSAPGPLQLAYQSQLQALSTQEVAVLRLVGVEPEVAQATVQITDADEVPVKPHKRKKPKKSAG